MTVMDEMVERLIEQSPDPDGVRDRLNSFASKWPECFAALPRKELLIGVFGYSNAYSEDVLKRPEWIEELAAADDLHRPHRPDEIERDLAAVLASGGDFARSLVLFRRKRLLRVLVRDVLGLSTLPQVVEEISLVADTILQAAYTKVRADLVARYGEPVNADGRETGFSVIALGKLGGAELNYSSDIDLMFVFSENGDTVGPSRITNKEFYKKLAHQLTETLSGYTPDGLCYRVDLRLRPEGRYGELCISLEAARQYYGTRARDWELQMLIKARVAAGEPGPGRELLDAVDPLIYKTTLDFSAVESMSEARQRISEKLTSRRSPGPAFDVKLTPGGIRDIEFLVQCLQRLHGGREPWVRHGGTMLALSRLHDKQLLSSAEFWRLSEAYQFLRDLEHRIQCVDDRQSHTLPSNPKELDLLARRMPAGSMGPVATGDALRARLNERLEDVVEIYERVIHAQKPMYYTHVPSAAEPEPNEEPHPVPSNLVRFLDQKAPDFAGRIAAAGMRRSSRRLELFLERVTQRPGALERLNADERLSAGLLELFEHSPYFGEELIRFPDLFEDVAAAGPVDYAEAARGLANPAEMRRFYRREMTRLAFQSVVDRASIFETLQRTSDLAEAVIGAAFRMAAGEENVPLMVIALGRLGMREFDLASDADLVFVLPDSEAGSTAKWTRVAAKTIELLTAYTGEGIVFAVDTRLRPNGREGDLVQTASGFKQYFENRAEAWEGIAYMKARGVAGDLAGATAFLSELQDVDWRRWGQSGRSRADLRAMRARLEREQSKENMLKAGWGGYYDIDFALMYLRLKSAGMFFKVLNTPARIDVIERMGHLEREDAAFLREAANFHRALDHGLRIYSGHAEGALPSSESKLAALTELVARWLPGGLAGRTLATELERVRIGTRAIFDRLFA